MTDTSFNGPQSLRVPHFYTYFYVYVYKLNFIYNIFIIVMIIIQIDSCFCAHLKARPVTPDNV